MKKLFLLRIVLFLAPSSMVWAQVPIIQSVQPLNPFPKDTVVITGSGFSATPSALEVWFDQVKGTITSSTDFSIEVIVPPQAKMNVIEVLNRNSQLSAKANLKLMPSFSGETFNVSNFASPVSFIANEELWDLSTKDFNVDGKPDIVATKFSSASIFTAPSTDLMILQNNSTPGSLTTSSFTKLDKTNLPVLNLTFPTDNVVTGDLQGDGKPEIVVSRAGSTRNSVLIFRNTSAIGGAIGFAAPITLSLDPTHVATRIVIRDLNKDGKPELIVSNSFNDLVYIFINQSSAGTIAYNATPIKLSIKVFASDASSTNYEVEVQDFNNDNLPDLVVNEFQEDSLHIFKNTSASSISFAPRVSIPTTDKFNRLNSADINNDGKLDLICTSTLGNKVLIFTNQSASGNIAFSSSPISLTTATGAWGVDVGDIDGDGDPDIVNTNRDEKAINIFLHNGNFSPPGFTANTITTSNNTRNIKLADMDGDGKSDIIFTSFTTFTSSLNTSSLQILRNTNCHKPDILNDNALAVGESFTICNGQTIRLKTISASNIIFTWKKDGVTVGGNNPFLDITAPGAAGNYTVTASETVGSCSVVSSSLAVIEDSGTAPANPVITANTPLCSGTQLTLSTPAVTNATYIWTGPNGFTSSQQNPAINNISTAQSGEYTLQVKVGVCKSNVKTKLVDVADLADFTVTSNNPTNTICLGNSLILSVNNLANHTYQWKKNGTNITINATSATLTVTEEGVYSVDVTNTVLNCNKVVGSASVIVLTPPVASYQVDNSACTQEQITFTNQSTLDTRGTPVLLWNFGDGTTSQTNNPTKKYTTAQTFNTSLAVSYSGVTGCSNNTSKPVIITNSVQPVIISSKVSLCPEESASLSVSGTFTSITWSNNATGNSTTITGPDTYSVTTADANGCPGQDDIEITAKPIPVLTVTATPSVIASGATSQLLATGATTYVWTPAESLDNATAADPKASPISTTEYTVVGTSNECSATATITVTIDGALNFPKSFTPNGDGQFDVWNIGAQDKPDCTISIFDGRGRRIFESRGENWDGKYQGQTVPDGTYYFVFGCPNEKPITGNLLVYK